MRYTIEMCEDKMAGNYGAIKEVVVRDVSGITSSGTIWKKQKDGTDYPDFDTLVKGAEFEANAWTNPKTGKVSFFPPKSQGVSSRGFGGAEKAVVRKEKSIEKSMDRKDESIMTSSTMRDSVLIVTTLATYEKYPEHKIAEKIDFWRKWLVDNWDLK